MTDKDILLSDLNDISEILNNNGYGGWCAIIQKAVAMLKEQEAVKPKYNAKTNWFECGACHFSMTSGMHCRSELIPAYKVGFCAKCGKGVLWE